MARTQPSRWYRRYDISVGTKYTGIPTGCNGGTTPKSPSTRRSQLLAVEQRRPTHSVALDRLTRGGPIMGTPASPMERRTAESRRRARNGWGVDLNGGRDENGGWEQDLEMSFSSPWRSLGNELRSAVGRGTDTRQFVTTEGNGRAETFRHPIRLCPRGPERDLGSIPAESTRSRQTSRSRRTWSRLPRADDSTVSASCWLTSASSSCTVRMERRSSATRTVRIR